MTEAKKLSKTAQAGFDAFCKTWREAKRWDHETYIRAWENCADAMIYVFELEVQRLRDKIEAELGQPEDNDTAEA
jgi:hypothetical protein